MQARRVAFALLAAGSVHMAFLPLHEYAHCVVGWITGKFDACNVTYAPPLRTLECHSGRDCTAVASTTAGEARTWGRTSYSWEHPLIYTTDATLSLLAGALVMRNGRADASMKAVAT